MGVSPDLGAPLDTSVDSAPPDGGAADADTLDGDVDAGATGGEQIVLMDFSEGAPLKWVLRYGGADHPVVLEGGPRSFAMSLEGRTGVVVEFNREGDFFTWYSDGFSAPFMPLQLVIAFGVIPPSEQWFTGHAIDNEDHRTTTATTTSLMVSNGDPAHGSYDITVTNASDVSYGQQLNVGIGQTTQALGAPRNGALVQVSVDVVGVFSHTWVLPELPEDRYHLVIREHAQEAWLVGGDTATVINLP